jgi:transcriptional regulator with XRE-family HTH domain
MKGGNMKDQQATSAERGGKFVRDIRERKRLSTYDMVDLLKKEGISTSVSSYAAMERGATDNVFNPSWIKTLARILGFSIPDLLVSAGYLDRLSGFDADDADLANLIQNLDVEGRRTVKELAEYLIAKQVSR